MLICILIIFQAEDGIRDRSPSRGLVVMSDLCLDEFTDHGHCGVLTAEGTVDNDATLEIYARMGVAQAEVGADVLGPSGMMDGQVRVIREALEGAGHHETAILAYAAKYLSLIHI